MLSLLLSPADMGKCFLDIWHQFCTSHGIKGACKKHQFKPFSDLFLTEFNPNKFSLTETEFFSAPPVQPRASPCCRNNHVSSTVLPCASSSYRNNRVVCSVTVVTTACLPTWFQAPLIVMPMMKRRILFTCKF